MNWKDDDDIYFQFSRILKVACNKKCQIHTGSKQNREVDFGTSGESNAKFSYSIKFLKKV